METEVYRGYNIEIHHDETPMDPRKDWDNIGKMYCWHRSYNLGDKHNYENLDDIKADHSDILLILPIFMYDHSGITISHGAFSCQWDSGQIGWHIVTKSGIKAMCGDDDKYYTEAKCKEYLEGELKTYDHYVTGAVYGYNIEGVEDGALFGFYGYDHEESGLMDEARSTIDAHINWERKTHYKKLKQWIKAKVPYYYRMPLQFI